MQIHPNLMFDGRCEAALKLYEECLHGNTVFMMTYEQAPQPNPGSCGLGKENLPCHFCSEQLPVIRFRCASRPVSKTAGLCFTDQPR